jgi:serine/threonine-protein kinase
MRRRTTVRLGLAAFGIAVGLAAGARPARAQDKAAAEALFDEGKRLFLEKKYADACPRFESSARLDPGIGTSLYLADCYENVGRIASAWATFREAASLAKAVGQTERETVARERAARLEPRLFRLTLKVDPAATTVKVKRNDAEVKPEAWNAPLPVDPGPYVISATAPGKKAWSTRIEVPSNAGGQTVLVPALEDDPAALKVVEKPAASPPPPRPPPPPPETKPAAAYVAGGVLTGVGAVGIGIGGILAGVAASKSSSANALCPNVQCGSMTGVSLSTQAGTFADAATGMFIAGGALAAAGVLVLTLGTRTSKPSTQASAWIAPVVAPGTAGLWAGRAW